MNILGEIMRGGSEKVIEAGGTLAGGHSIADSDVKYGLSVMGVVHPDRVLANNQGQPGDKLILTRSWVLALSVRLTGLAKHLRQPCMKLSGP